MRPLRGDDAALNLRDPAGQLLARDARPLNSGATCDVWGYTYPHGTAMAGTRVAVKRIQHGRLPHQCRNNREDLTRLAKAMLPEGGLIPTEVTNAGSQETALIMEIGTDMVRVSVRAVPIVCVNACLCVSVSVKHGTPVISVHRSVGVCPCLCLVPLCLTFRPSADMSNFVQRTTSVHQRAPGQTTRRCLLPSVLAGCGRWYGAHDGSQQTTLATLILNLRTWYL